MTKVKLLSDFIQEAIKIHGSCYDYSKVNYINSNTKVKIYCKKCNEYFWQSPRSHIYNKSGCPNCSKNKKLTLDKFIIKAKEIHGNKYDYNEVKFKNIHDKIKIYCKKCKTYFYQVVDKHLLGHNCPECMKVSRRLKAIEHSNINKFVDLANKIHKDRYDYSNINYINNKTPIQIYCKRCKKYFKQQPIVHLSGCGCPYCRRSKGETIISEWLDNNKIKYIEQKRFKDCRDKNPLPFDFYLPEYNICIEYQGEQHYKEGFNFYLFFYKKDIEKAKIKYNKLKKHDKLKKYYCKNKKIKLIEISYKDNIELKLEFLKSLKNKD